MAVFMKFEGSNASRYGNSLHAAYHKAVLNVLKETGEENLKSMHVSGELQEVYATTVADLEERTMEAQASVDTQSTMAYDVERDRLLSMLFFLVASGVLSSVAEEQAAAKKLEVILRVYKGIQGKADDSETQLIDALLVDLKKSENAEAVATLRLGEIITQLEAVNNKFRAAKEVRIKQRNTKRLQAKTQELRSLADGQLEEIQDFIRATGIVASVTPDSDLLLGMVVDLINDINAQTANFRIVFNQSQAQKKSQAEKKKESEMLE